MVIGRSWHGAPSQTGIPIQGKATDRIRTFGQIVTLECVKPLNVTVRWSKAHIMYSATCTDMEFQDFRGFGDTPIEAVADMCEVAETCWETYVGDEKIELTPDGEKLKENLEIWFRKRKEKRASTR